MKLDTREIITIVSLAMLGLASGFVSAYQYYEAKKSEKEASISQNKADEKTDLLIEAQNELIEAQRKASENALQSTAQLEKVNKELQEKTEDLVIKQSELLKLQSETIKNIGGYGHAFVKSNLKDNRLEFSIKSASDYNMYDVNIHSINLDGIKKCEFVDGKPYHVTNACYQQNTSKVYMQTLSAKFIATINYSPIVKEHNFYLFKISSNNITTIQYTYIYFDSKTNRIASFYRIAEFDRISEDFKIIDKSEKELEDKFWIENFPYLYNIFVH